MSKTTFIYFLRDPTNPTKGYVGKSNSPDKRFKNHLSNKGVCRRTNWIQALRKQEAIPLLEILDEVPENEWQAWEAAYIEFFCEQGYELVNGTAGGDCGPIMCGANNPRFGKPKWEHPMFGKTGTKHPCFGRLRTPAERAKLSAAKSKEKHPFFGKRHSLIAIAKQSASKAGLKNTRNTSGFCGISWDKLRQKWWAYFRISKKKQIYVGAFIKIEDAVFARALALENHLTSVANSRT